MVEDDCSVQSTKLNPAKTPTGRLAWRDLLGETCTPKKHEETIPGERILWNSERDTVSSTIFPMISRRPGRKRARSSSPSSSPSNSKPTTPAVNVKKLAQALKTPHGDPALELWDRFSLPVEDNPVSSGLTNPLLAHLMVSSSPRPARDGDAAPTESNFRRAFSCGTHWPKRRKLERPGQLSTVTCQGSPRGDSKSSMVSALLETVTGEINRSSSAKPRSRALESPSPTKKSRPQRCQASPTKPPAASTTVASIRAEQFIEDETSTTQNHILADSPSSDYGDVDFDDDTLFELDANIPTLKNDDTAPLPMERHAQDTMGSHCPNTTLDDDAFDELDDDIFDAVEDILAHGTQTAPCTTHNSQAHGEGSKHTVQDGENNLYSDSFGSDFDFEAVELAATQEASRAQPPPTTVCTLR